MEDLSSCNGAQALVGVLLRHDVRHVFCVPGESYLAALDALRDSEVEITVCRNEGGAAMMAEAVGKATGEPGVCFVTRGPGATNASAGLFVARHDSTPMILFVGQVERAFRGRDAFQEMDYAQFFGGVAKYVVEIDDARRLDELVSRAFEVASSGRPGPVVVSLPKDMLTDPCGRPGEARAVRHRAAPSEEAMRETAAAIARARRPIFVLGGSGWSKEARADMMRFAEGFRIPVTTSYRRSGLFDQLHACYAGDLGLGADPKLVSRVKTADLVVLVGGRLGEIPSQGFTLLDAPHPRMALIHVHPDPQELGRLYQPAVAIEASPAAFAAALARLPAPQNTQWSEGTAEAHQTYLRWSETATPQPGDVNLGEIFVWLRERLPRDAIICNGAGNYAAWIHRFYRFREIATHIAPTSASMGYGVPAAVAMKRLHPRRDVVCVAGDGDFLMNGQEFATAAQYDLPIVFVVCDNASYGTIRMHQEREYPGRVVATDLRNPDFAAFARSFGGFGTHVRRTQEFAAAFEAAAAAGVPAIVHVHVDVRAITPTKSLDEIRGPGPVRA